MPAKPDLAELSRFDPATAPKPNLRFKLPSVIMDGALPVLAFITAVWGVGYILEATVRVGLVMALSPALIVGISPLMMFAVIIGLTVWTRPTLFAARERRIRELQSGSPA